MKNEIEKIIAGNHNWFVNEGKSATEIIALFNKHIEDKKDSISEKVEEHDYESLSNDEVADNIINILKIKE